MLTQANCILQVSTISWHGVKDFYKLSKVYTEKKKLSTLRLKKMANLAVFVWIIELWLFKIWRKEKFVSELIASSWKSNRHKYAEYWIPNTWTSNVGVYDSCWSNLHTNFYSLYFCKRLFFLVHRHGHSEQSLLINYKYQFSFQTCV